MEGGREEGREGGSEEGREDRSEGGRSEGSKEEGRIDGPSMMGRKGGRKQGIRHCLLHEPHRNQASL